MQELCCCLFVRYATGPRAHTPHTRHSIYDGRRSRQPTEETPVYVEAPYIYTGAGGTEAQASTAKSELTLC